MPPKASLSHRVIKNASLPYVSNLSPTNTNPCFIPGSQDLLTGIVGYAQRRPGFADNMEPTPTTFSSLSRIFTWNRTDGTFIEMACDVVAGQSVVFKRIVGLDNSFVSIYTDTTSGTPLDFRVSNNTVYFSNGHVAKKWDPINGVSNWGIAIGSINNATGPNRAGNGANGGAPGTAWTNPNNVSSTTLYATVTTSSSSQFDQATQFGFAIASTVTITGIQVDAEAFGTGGNNPAIFVQLLKAGNPTGTQKSVALPTSNTNLTFGGTADLWGSNWVANDTNQTTFGVQLGVAQNNPGSSLSASLRNVRITVYGLGGPAVAVSGSAGTFSATVGYSYVFTYGNSNTGHISSPTPASASTGVFTNRLNVQVSLTASTDPQVNQIHVYRSTDSVATGNVAGTYFELPTSPYPNTTANITDNAPDTSLQVASIAPTPTFNDPPTPGRSAVYFAGRIWMFSGNKLYFSSLEECVAGVPEESWPSGLAGNFWAFDEALTGLAVAGSSVNQTLVIYCGGRLYGIVGNTLDTFRRFLISDRRGTRNLTTITSSGGAVAWLDTSNQVWLSDGTALQEIGTDIRPDLSGLNPALCSMTFHTDTVQHWLVLSTGTKLFVYDADTEQWMPPWSFSCQYVWSGEIAPGDYRLMAAKPTKGVQLSVTGANNDQGATYQPIIQTSNFAMVPDFGSRFSAAGLGTYDEPSRTSYPCLFQIDTNANPITDVAQLVDDDPLDSSLTYTSIFSQSTTPQVAYNRGQGSKLVQNVWSMLRPTARWISWRFQGANADDSLKIYGFWLAYKETE